jgi:hypothetical protein
VFRATATHAVLVGDGGVVLLRWRSYGEHLDGAFLARQERADCIVLPEQTIGEMRRNRGKVELRRRTTATSLPSADGIVAKGN